jgi:hypothetical protein
VGPILHLKASPSLENFLFIQTFSLVGIKFYVFRASGKWFSTKTVTHLHWESYIKYITSQGKWYMFYMGTYKVRNEIETKRNQRKRNEINKNETNRNEINEIKRNQRNQRKTMLDYFPHMSQCLSPGEDRILSPLNKNTMHLFSGSLSFSLSGFF